MNGSLYLTSIKAASALRLRIVGAVYFYDPAIDTAGTGYKVGIHQTNLIAWKHTEVLSRRLFHKVLSLYIQLPAKGYLSCSHSLILKIISYSEHLCLILRIVINDQSDRIKNRHHSRSLQLQILSDTVLQHGIICR